MARTVLHGGPYDMRVVDADDTRPCLQFPYTQQVPVPIASEDMPVSIAFKYAVYEQRLFRNGQGTPYPEYHYVDIA